MKEPRARGTNPGCKQRLIGGGLQSAYWLLLEVGVGVGGEGRVQASPVSFTFNASNLIVLVELSKTEKEVGLSSLDLADTFFVSPAGVAGDAGELLGSLGAAGSMILTPISLH